MLSENPINRTPEALPDPKQYGDPIVFAVALTSLRRPSGDHRRGSRRAVPLMLHDTVVMGAPAGLSAALNGAAEGLNTLLLERAPELGGQAGTTVATAPQPPSQARLRHLVKHVGCLRRYNRRRPTPRSPICHALRWLGGTRASWLREPNAPEIPGNLKLRPRPGLIALHRRRISKYGTHDEHPPARDEMRQVVRQPLDVFGRLLLKALHSDDLRDQHVIS